MAQMSDGRLRIAESTIRKTKAMGIGIRFLAAKDERESAPMNPRIVATKAILMVSTIPMYPTEQKNSMSFSHTGYDRASKTDQFGGHILSPVNVSRLSIP